MPQNSNGADTNRAQPVHVQPETLCERADCTRVARPDAPICDHHHNPCRHCGTILDDVYETVCDTCRERYYTECNSCGDEIERSDAYTHAGDSYCESCYNDLVEDEAESWPEREYYGGNSASYQNAKEGTIVKSTRIFSAEIECYAPDARAYNRVYNAIPDGIGATTDGSLGERGMEFQTPKLKGERGEAILRGLCKALNDNDFTVNRSTGLHIHLDGRGLFPRTKTMHEPKALKHLWAFYRAYEPVMHSVLPEERRTNRYCKPIAKEAALQQVIAAHNLRDLEKCWYRTDRVSYIDDRKRHKYDDSRYCGVNLHSLLGAKHIEIRYHSGTLNAVKILEWVNLHLRILDKAAARALDPEYSMSDMLAYESKKITLAELTGRMFERLDLTASSRAYFMRRQARFTGHESEDALLESGNTN